jgi:type II secretory pathway predicted ATPase ExeA
VIGDNPHNHISIEGCIVALCGVIGSGKTVTLRRLQQRLKDENKITVFRSLTVEKQSIKLGTLIAVLFYDLSPGKKTVPSRVEDRERELQELVKKASGWYEYPPASIPFIAYF